MDMLFHRYSSPLMLLDTMIASRSLAEFVKEVVTIHNEEHRDEMQWELWLHKVWDKDYETFSNSMKPKETAREASKEDIAQAVSTSASILAGFVPT